MNHHGQRPAGDAQRRADTPHNHRRCAPAQKWEDRETSKGPQRLSRKGQISASCIHSWPSNSPEGPGQTDRSKGHRQQVKQPESRGQSPLLHSTAWQPEAGLLSAQQQMPTEATAGVHVHKQHPHTDNRNHREGGADRRSQPRREQVAVSPP